MAAGTITRFLGRCLVALSVLAAMVPVAHAVSTETSNGCRGTQDDPCIRSGSCEIQGAMWTQDVTIDRSDIFDTQGWPGLCDMVHVGLVQGDCEPGGAQQNVTVHLSTTSFAFVPAITGPLSCAGGTCEDGDSDGVTTCDGDCDDADPTRRPGAEEVCNGIDDDCDSQIDESCTVEIPALPGGSSGFFFAVFAATAAFAVSRSPWRRSTRMGYGRSSERTPRRPPSASEV